MDIYDILSEQIDGKSMGIMLSKSKKISEIKNNLASVYKIEFLAVFMNKYEEQKTKVIDELKTK